jgi:hypothetical protein
MSGAGTGIFEEANLLTFIASRKEAVAFWQGNRCQLRLGPVTTAAVLLLTVVFTRVSNWFRVWAAGER